MTFILIHDCHGEKWENLLFVILQVRKYRISVKWEWVQKRRKKIRCGKGVTSREWYAREVKRRKLEKKRKKWSCCGIEKCAAQRREWNVCGVWMCVYSVCVCVCVRQFDGQSSVHLHDQDNSDQILSSTTKRNTTHSAVRYSTVRSGTVQYGCPELSPL